MTAVIASSQSISRAHRKVVQETYEQVARNPYGPFPLHRGPYYARRFLGYPESDLAELPQVALDRFTGVGNPFAAGDLYPGEAVLDLGCGAGTDLLIAARRVGPDGRVIGVDFSPAMRTCARIAVRATGLSARVEILAGRLPDLPLEDQSADLVIGNGILSAVEDRLETFREVRRVLKPGGRVYLADLVAERLITVERKGAPDLWRRFLQGAPSAEELLELAARAGLREVHAVACYDCLRDAPISDTGRGAPRVHGITLFAIK